MVLNLVLQVVNLETVENNYFIFWASVFVLLGYFWGDLFYNLWPLWIVVNWRSDSLLSLDIGKVHRQLGQLSSDIVTFFELSCNGHGAPKAEVLLFLSSH